MDAPLYPLRRHGACRRGFETLRAVALVTYQEWAAYRSHMLLSLVIGPAYFLAQSFVWTAVFAGHGTLGGFDLPAMLRYYGISTLVYYLTMDFADWNLQMHIREGSFLTFLLRPLSHRWFALAQKVGRRTLGFLFELVPVWAILALGFGVVLVPAHWFWAVVSILLGFLMMFLINYCLGLLAFWLVRTDGLRSLFALVRDVLAGTLIPLSFFPDFLQQLSFFLPFAYTCYVPVQVFQGSFHLTGVTLELPVIVGFQALAVVVMAGFSELLWRQGERRFTGAGA